MSSFKDNFKGEQAAIAVYNAVAARRMQWDNLIWQVPLLGFTALAFLLNIALGPDTGRAARILASILASVVSALCMHLMAKHRQADVTDAETLEKMEKHLPKLLRQHGQPWRTRRMLTPPEKGLVHKLVRPWGTAYPAWIAGLGMFFLVSIAILVGNLLPTPWVDSLMAPFRSW